MTVPQPAGEAAAAASHGSVRDTLIGVALMALCAILIGLLPSLSLIAFKDGTNIETYVVIRSIISAAIIAVFIVLTRGSFHVPRAAVPMMAVVGVAAVLMNFTVLGSIQFIDISLSVVIIFAHPFLVALYYHAIGTTRLTKARFFWGIVTFVGLGMALAVNFDRISSVGVGLAAACAVIRTVVIVTMVDVRDRIGSTTTNFHIQIWAVGLFALSLAVTGDVRWPHSSVGWFATVANAISYAGAYVVFFAAVKFLGAARATMFGFLEPIATILLAMAIFGETLSPVQWGGVALVLAGLFFMEARLGTRVQTVAASQSDDQR